MNTLTSRLWAGNFSFARWTLDTIVFHRCAPRIVMNGYAFEFEVSRNGEECWEYSSFITNTVDRFERVFETVDGPSTSGNLGVSEFVAGSSSKWSQPVVVPFLQLCNRKDRSEVKRFMRHVWTRGTKHFPNLRRITEIHKSSLDGDIQPNSWNSS